MRTCRVPFGISRLLGGSGGRGATALPVGPRFCLTPLGDTARSASGPYQLVATSATAPVVSGRWRVLGAALRRAIASRKAVPADIKDQTSRPLRGKTEIVCHIPPPNASGDFGKLKFCARGAEVDERRETRAETRRRETMRQCGFANISSSHVSARLSSIVSRPRAHAYSASGDHVRGTSHIAIGEMAGIWREIMVRNVVFGGIAARPEGSPHPARRDASPHHWLPLRRSRGDRRAVRNSGALGDRALPFCRDKRGLSFLGVAVDHA